MDAQPKTAIIPFVNKGMTTRADARQLPPGVWQSMVDITSEAEGSVTLRRGRANVGNLGTASAGHTMAKLVIGPGEIPVGPSSSPTPGLGAGGSSTNYRYIGAADQIYRSQTLVAPFTNVTSGLVVPSVCTDPGNPSVNISRFWSEANYSAGATGNPWAFFACEKQMLKDQGSAPFTVLHQWGINTAYGVAEAVDGGSPGNLDGGAASSPAGSLPYSYVYTYRDPLTGNEGNPSQVMLSDSSATNGTPVAVHLRNVTVTVYGTNDLQITGPNSIAIYRAGGTFADGFYRFVGYVANIPGSGVFHTYTFTDNTSDIDLVFARIVETDNDAPVTSSLPSPAITTLSANLSAGVNTGISVGSTTNIRDRSLIHIIPASGSSTAKSELAIVNISAPNTIGVYCQYAHSTSDIIECDAVSSQPCNLALASFDSLFVAGDKNNPHVLYKSKTGMPESFPVIDALGNSGTINVGSPSNPIVNICEFRGNVICLNAQNIFEVPVYNGVMYAPNVTPAQRGLLCKDGWCIGDNAIWYLAYDGIYSWSGGESQKISDAVDEIFHGTSYTCPTGGTVFTPDLGSIHPISTNPVDLQFAKLAFYRKKLYFYYVDLNQTVKGLMYDTIYNRWIPINPNHHGYTEPAYFVPFVERDTGNFVTMQAEGSVLSFSVDDYIDSSGLTRDECGIGNGTAGDPISGQISTGWIDGGNEYMVKLFDEILLDCDPAYAATFNGIDINIFSNYNITSPVAQFKLVTPTAGPGRQWISIGGGWAGSSSLFNNGLIANVILIQFSLKQNQSGSGLRPTLYAMKLRFQEAGEITAGPYYDYSDLGHKYDKRLYEFTVEYDATGITNSATTVVLAMDTVFGILGSTPATATQTFTITPTSQRGKITIPIVDGEVCKLVRIRSQVFPDGTGPFTTPLPSSSTMFRILNIDFQKEDYPADTTLFCEWQDDGYTYLKYANQISFDVDTNGVPVNVQIQTDGGVVAQTISVNTTQADRIRNITLNPILVSRKWRWFVDPTQTVIANATGKFQVFSYHFRFQQADKGEVIHSADWDDLGHPWDKYLQTVTVEYENDGGPAVNLQMDTLTGIKGQTITSSVATFALTGTTGRCKQIFALQPDTIAKMVHIYPSGPLPAGFRQWKYSVQKIDYPPDIILSTEWRDAQTIDDKNPSWLAIDMDTAGVGCVVELQNESGFTLTVNHIGTVDSRMANYAIPVDKIGKMWRLLLIPGVGGKAQLFKWQFHRWSPFDQLGPIDPPETILWTPWNDWKYPYPKAGRNLILDVDTGGVAASVQIQGDGGVVLQTVSVSTTYTNRHVVLALNANLISNLWRLVVTPGNGGRWKLWDWQLDYIKLPAAVTSVDTLEQDFGTERWKWIKEAWIHYSAPAPVTMTVIVEGGHTFFTQTLPVQAPRDIFRFFFPSIQSGVLNKSRTYRVQFTSAQPFYLFSDSRIDWLPWNADQGASFQGFHVGPELNQPVG